MFMVSEVGDPEMAFVVSRMGRGSAPGASKVTAMGSLSDIDVDVGPTVGVDGFELLHPVRATTTVTSVATMTIRRITGA